MTAVTTFNGQTLYRGVADFRYSKCRRCQQFKPESTLYHPAKTGRGSRTWFCADCIQTVLTQKPTKKSDHKHELIDELDF